MTAQFTVLISSAGRRVSLLRAFREALHQTVGEAGRVIATDASTLSAAAWDADDRYIAPRCDDPEFISFMLRLCRDQNVSLLIPTIDTELTTLAAHSEDFLAVGTRVLISSPEVIKIASDKKQTNQFLQRHGLPAVRQTEPESLAPDIETWAFPLIAKPRRGSASVGVRIIQEADEIDSLSPDYVLEEFAPGHEYTMDVFLDVNGDCQVVVPRLRLETRSGEVSKGVTARIPQLDAVVRNACRELPGARGVLTFQAFLEEGTGTARIIEINPRFGGGYPLSYAAGANFPLWLIQEGLGSPSEANNEAWTEGLTMLRYDDAIFVPKKA